MKKIALSLMMVLGCITAKATDGKSLFVTFDDGQKVEFALATLPEVTFGNDQMTVSTTDTNASYELWKVKTFTYGTPTGIDQATSDGKFAIDGNRIVIDGTANKVSVFALDGKAVQLSATTQGDKTVIYIDKLPKGVTIIKINNQAIKIARQ